MTNLLIHRDSMAEGRDAMVEARHRSVEYAEEIDNIIAPLQRTKKRDLDSEKSVQVRLN